MCVLVFVCFLFCFCCFLGGVFMGVLLPFNWLWLFLLLIFGGFFVIVFIVGGGT